MVSETRYSALFCKIERMHCVSRISLQKDHIVTYLVDWILKRWLRGCSLMNLMSQSSHDLHLFSWRQFISKLSHAGCSPDPVSCSPESVFAYGPNAAKVKWSAILMGGTGINMRCSGWNNRDCGPFHSIRCRCRLQYEIHTSTVNFYWNRSICLLFWNPANTASIVYDLGSISLGWWAMAKRKANNSSSPMLIMRSFWFLKLKARFEFL